LLEVMVCAANCTGDASPNEDAADKAASEAKACDGGALARAIPFGFAPMTSAARVSSGALTPSFPPLALEALLASLLALRRRRGWLADPVCLRPRPWLRPRRRCSPPRWRSRLREVASRRRRAIGRWQRGKERQRTVPSLERRCKTVARWVMKASEEEAGETNEAGTDEEEEEEAEGEE
jgi:hypothetical protein